MVLSVSRNIEWIVLIGGDGGGCCLNRNRMKSENIGLWVTNSWWRNSQRKEGKVTEYYFFFDIFWCKGVLPACMLMKTSGCCWHVLFPTSHDQMSMLNNIFGHQCCLASSTHQHHCLDIAADWGIWKPTSLCCLDCSNCLQYHPTDVGPKAEEWNNEPV